MVGTGTTCDSSSITNSTPNYVINVLGEAPSMSIVTSTPDTWTSSNSSNSVSGTTTVQTEMIEIPSTPNAETLPTGRGEKRLVKLAKVVGTRISSPCWTSGTMKSITVSKQGMQLIATEEGE